MFPTVHPCRWWQCFGSARFAGNLGNGVLRLLFVVAVALMISIQPQAYRNVGLQLILFYRRRGRRILISAVLP